MNILKVLTPTVLILAAGRTFAEDDAAAGKMFVFPGLKKVQQRADVFAKRAAPLNI